MAGREEAGQRQGSMVGGGVASVDREDVGLITGSGRVPGEGNGSPLQYSCLRNPMDRGACRARVHGVTKSQTQLKQLSTDTSQVPGTWRG